MFDFIISALIYVYQSQVNGVESFQAFQYAASWLPWIAGILGAIGMAILIGITGLLTAASRAVGAVSGFITVLAFVFLGLKIFLASAIANNVSAASDFSAVNWVLVATCAVVIVVMSRFKFKTDKKA